MANKNWKGFEPLIYLEMTHIKKKGPWPEKSYKPEENDRTKRLSSSSLNPSSEASMA